MLPSFPQRGQTTPPRLLDVPDDAPQWVKKWLTTVKLSAEFVRWFGLLKPEIDSVREEINQGMVQLLGQADQLDVESLIARVTQFTATPENAQRQLVLVAPGSDPEKLTRQAWSTFIPIYDTRANRANYPAAQFDGSLYLESDTGSTLVYKSVAGIWFYADGVFKSTLAGILTGLGTADAGLKTFITDYSHQLEWGGAVWGPKWGPENPMTSGMYCMFESAPAGDGTNAWQVCDGTTVARLNPDGTTTNVATPNLATPGYLKGGTAAAAVAAASGTTAGTSLNPTTDNFTQVTPTVAAVTGFDDPHSHGPGSIELRNKQVALYYRR